ncbi:MAG TPA: S1/P1 nuclease [Pirellulales bacterium]
MNRLRSLFILAVISLPATCLAWTQAGHMATGAVAYDTLKEDDPQALTEILATLRQHPQYQSMWAGQLDRVDPADRDQALFMLAARWPDDIRNNPDYNHPDWHYIDYGYKPAGQPDSVEIAPPPDPNILTAYRQNLEVLKKASASPGDKAIALCWIMHLTGDSHQPLHAVSLFSTDYPGPKGDQGATKAFIRVKSDSRPINLHRFWDDLVLGSDDTRDVKKKAIELRAAYPRAELDPHPDQVTGNDMDKWIQESMELAKSDVYLDGKLATSPGRDSAPVLPAEYIPKSKTIGERRATQSGYHMADILKKIAPDLASVSEPANAAK